MPRRRIAGLPTGPDTLIEACGGDVALVRRVQALVREGAIMATNAEPPGHDTRCERLVEAARRVWLGASLDRERWPLQRMVVNREAIDALGQVLAQFGPGSSTS